MWLSLAILSYVAFAFGAFLDKYILGKVLLSPKVYACYTGILALVALALVPLDRFTERELFFVPSLPLVILSFIAGIVFIFFLFVYYKGVRDFEISRIVPTVGGITPLFILGLVYFLVSIFPDIGFTKEVLETRELLALAFLVLGSVVMTLHRKKLATFRSLKISIVASFLLGLTFVLSKLAYDSFHTFWAAFIWIGIGKFLGGTFFLVFKEVRDRVFAKREDLKEKIAFTFLAAKIAGGLGSLFQNGAIYLAPVLLIPLVNALSGIQYVFLIVLATLFFFKFPSILKEEISRKVLVQKTLAIWLIAAGLALLYLG